MIFALAGNQNSGKTTLFNQLTGSNQHVGNWPGVTVEKKEGRLKSEPGVSLVDLPGIYSLSPYTPEEIISRNFLVDGGVDAVINILDATNIERNLYLTLQLIELRRPMVVALNMMDEVRAAGGSIDTGALERALGVPVVLISARRREGVDRLMRAAMQTARQKDLPPVLDICQGPLHDALHAIALLIQEKVGPYTPRFAATKLVEGDRPMQEALGLTQHEIHIVSEIVEMMEHKSHMERDAALADARYRFIETLTAKAVRRGPERRTLSERIDAVATHRVLAIPVFLAVMLLVFTIALGPIGTFLTDVFAELIDSGIGAAGTLLENAGASAWVQGLVVDGILTGVGSVLGFLPVILLLFLCLSLLEDSGYMTRAAFVMDSPLRRMGLSGRSFIPMLMGFGCSVPAAMATRTLESDRDKRFTITLIPFMSCGAKLPIYALFVTAFFPRFRGAVMFSIYLLGILAAVLSALLLKRTAYKGHAAPFVMEMPTYRIPTLKNVALLMWDKAWDFLRRAFTIIFLATVIVWFLQSFGPDLRFVEDSADSLLARIGGFIAPLFSPLGFGTWEASTALLTGFMAKESVVSTMAVLYGAGDVGALPAILRQAFTPLTAWSFMAFALMYMPCVAAFAAMRREMGGFKYALRAVGFQTGLAWLAGTLIFQVGRLFV